MTGSAIGEAYDCLLTPSEVAARFGVDHTTVTRWARQRQIVHLRTPGGRLRFWESDIDRLLPAEHYLFTVPAGWTLDTRSTEVTSR